MNKRKVNERKERTKGKTKNKKTPKIKNAIGVKLVAFFIVKTIVTR